MTRSRKNDFEWSHFVSLAKKRFRRKHKKAITPAEIRHIYNAWVESVIAKVLEGEKVKIDKHSTLEIVGVPILEDENFKNLLLSGLMIRRDGTFKKAELSNRRDFKYKIVYKNKLNPDIIFVAHKDFSKRAHEKIIKTNTYFRISNEQASLSK